MEKECVFWQDIRERYERGGISFMALSKECGVPASVIGRRAKREDWGGDRKQYRKTKDYGDLDEMVNHLICVVSGMVNQVGNSEEMDVKTLKELTGVLKELNNLSKNKKEGKADCPMVRVVLEGEAEEWGR